MYDDQFFCDQCDFKCHKIHFLTAHKRAVHDVEENCIPKKRPRIQVATPPKAIIAHDKNSPKTVQDTIKTETVELLEQNEPCDDIPVSNIVKTEPISNQQKPKFSLKGLLNKSKIGVKIVSSIKVFNCAICKQEGVRFAPQNNTFFGNRKSNFPQRTLPAKANFNHIMIIFMVSKFRMKIKKRSRSTNKIWHNQDPATFNTMYQNAIIAIYYLKVETNWMPIWSPNTWRTHIIV